MALSFRGGFRLDGRKLTAREAIQTMPAPDFITVPLLQSKGDETRPLVKEGDRVLKGQRIAEGTEQSASLHAGVSGRVSAIKRVKTTLGECDAIVIENDHKDEISPEVKPFSTPIFQAEPEAICEHIREKGIVGMGGKAFPAAAKIEAARGKVRRLIINCAESEPYLTSDHRLLLEKAREVVGGVKILLRALSCEKAIFAVENNKEDAILAIQKVVGGSPNFAIASLRNKYPQGDEKHLVRTLTGEEIPFGALPIDMGVVTFNVETCWAIYRAFVTGMPAVERLITVSGDCIKKPSNLLVPIGVSVAEVIQFCGGCAPTPDRILSGGPMMGEEISDDSVPVTACVSAILALSVPEYREIACIRCGRCHRVCPMRLMPHELVRAERKENASLLVAYDVDSCSECGLCTYICPSRIPLLDEIRRGKARLAQDGE